MFYELAVKKYKSGKKMYSNEIRICMQSRPYDSGKLQCFKFSGEKAFVKKTHSFFYLSATLLLLNYLKGICIRLTHPWVDLKKVIMVKIDSTS